MNALNSALPGAVLAVWLTAAVISPALASKTEKVDELVGLHNLKTAVAIGNCYLKQQTLIAVREELMRLGRDQNLGPRCSIDDSLDGTRFVMSAVGRRSFVKALPDQALPAMQALLRSRAQG